MNKYLLRGFGIGCVFAAVVLFFINRPKQITDEEIISKAKSLGMITNEDLVERLKEERLSAIKESLNTDTDVVADKTEETSETPDSSGKTEEAKEPEPSPAPIDLPASEEGIDEAPEPGDDAAPIDIVIEPSDSDSETKEEPEVPTEPEDNSYYTLVITRGMTSEKVSAALFSAGVIDSATDFNSYLVRSGKSSVIRVGRFKISYDAEYDEIIKTITN